MRARIRGQLGGSFIIVLTVLFVWAFLIYWQGPVSLRGLGESLLQVARFDFEAIDEVYRSLIWGVFMLLAGGTFATVFFLLFALPIEDRTQIPLALRLIPGILTGRISQAVLLRNGEQRNAEEGLGKSSQRSIFHLDAASAALLRKGSVLTRTLGPGFHIGAPRETFAGGLDLRIQRRSTGPLPDENPFAPKQTHEGQAAYLARKSRREESTALSKDGVEVVPRIELLFQIEGQRGGNRKPFPFQAEFAWRALANEGVSPGSPSDLRDRQINWDWIPSQLAIDLWRIFLRKYTVRDLFEIVPGLQSGNGSKHEKTGLQEIEEQIKARLTKALVESQRGKQTSPEYQFLRNRGIRVIEASIREIHLDPRKEESRLVNEWSEDWELKAIQKSFHESELVDSGKREGLHQAANDFIRIVSEDLVERLTITDGEIIPPPAEEESLRLLLNSALRKLQDEPGMQPEIRKRMEAFHGLLTEGGDGE